MPRTVLCASYPFIHNVPALVLLGASEAIGFAAAMPAVQSLLTEGSAPSEVGRIQGMFATSQTACTAVAAAAAGAAFAVASWLPFVTVASIVFVALIGGGGHLEDGARPGATGPTVPGPVDPSVPAPARPRSWLRCWGGAGRGQRGRAVGAAAGRGGNLAQALGAFAHRLLVGADAQPVHQLVHRLDHQEEDHRGDEHEREQRVEEAPVGEL